MVVLQLLGTSCSCCNNHFITKLCASAITFYIYKWFSWLCFKEQFQRLLRHYKTKFIIINSCENFKLIGLIPQLNPVESFRTHIPNDLLYLVTPIWKLFCQFSSVTIAYPNLWFKKVPNIIGSNVFQLQNSLTTHCPVQILILTISYKINSSSNVSGVFGVLTIIRHADRWFDI